MRDALWLVRNGVPFDVAFDMSDARRSAFSIIFSEFEGSEFDLDAMRFKVKNDT